MRIAGIASYRQRHPAGLFAGDVYAPPIDRLQFTSRRRHRHLEGLRHNSITHICVDPPYYDNVNMPNATISFIVWMKRTFGEVYPALLGNAELTPKDEEAVANVLDFATRTKDEGNLLNATTRTRCKRVFAKCIACLNATAF